MSYAPVELRHVRPRRGVLGYSRRAVDDLLSDIADSFEVVWRERADLAEQTEHLDAELVRFKELEHLLRTTLVSAERAAQDMRERAEKEVRAVTDQAYAEARAITAAARAERERLLGEIRRMRALLGVALTSIEEAGEAGESRPGDERAAHPDAETDPATRDSADTVAYTPVDFEAA